MGPGHGWLRRMFRAALTGASVLVVAVVGYIVYAAVTLPRSPAASVAPSPAALLYTSENGEPLAVRGAYHGEPIRADQLPVYLAKAVVAIEDRRFYEHAGIDLRGIGRAALNNISGGEIEGGSTITQQLARMRYLSAERTLRRKVQEAMIALWLEARFSKNEILAQYLNTVYFGAGAIGADAAARRYFERSAYELDLAQSAMLAGLIRAPSALAPNRNPKAAERRAHAVLRAMFDEGAIDRAQFEAARAESVRLAVTPEPEPDRNYFLDAADAEVRRLIGEPPLDLTVTTTIDPRLQEAANRIVNAWLDREGKKRNVGQAALVAMAPDGAILAMIGGRDYLQSQYNRATQAHRQPGSLFKVFVYLAALSNGYRPDSVMLDKPVKIGDWEPRNHDGRYRGAVTLREAFADSINSVAVQLAQAVGPERIAALAHSLGVESKLPARPDLALGWAEVTLLEMTRAIDAIATGNRTIQPYTVRAIRAPSGSLYTRLDTAPDPAQWDRRDMMRLLEAVVTEGTGKAARLPDRRSAGKTGTSDAYRDAWFVGFTTELVVGVWVGNDDNSPMDKVTGGDLPARIWHDFVGEAGRIRAEPPAPPAVGSSARPATAARTAPAGR
jgi:penicillin-binding protein 1A